MNKNKIKEEFLENKYTKWYIGIVSKAIDEKRKKSKDNYYEMHHIIPKCKPFCGGNELENLVLLTAKEHFLCHLLLTKMCDGIKKYKMIWAFHRVSFSFPSESKKLTSGQYELARKKFSKDLSANHPSKDEKWRKRVSERVSADWEGNVSRKEKTSNFFKKYHEDMKENSKKEYYETQKRNSMIGAEKIKEKWRSDKDWVEVEKKKMSDRKKGEKNPMYGKKIEGEHRQKLSEATSRKRWLSKDGKSVYIDKDLVDIYILDGYTLGRSNYKRKETR
jgi:hypothetical protein